MEGRDDGEFPSNKRAVPVDRLYEKTAYLPLIVSIQSTQARQMYAGHTPKKKTYKIS